MATGQCHDRSRRYDPAPDAPPPRGEVRDAAQVQLLADHSRKVAAVAGDVAAGPCQALDEPGVQRIVDQRDDRDTGGGALRDARTRTARHDHIDVERDHFLHNLDQTFLLAFGRPALDDDVATFDEAEIAQRVLERAYVGAGRIGPR